MESSPRHGKFKPLRINQSARSGDKWEYFRYVFGMLSVLILDKPRLVDSNTYIFMTRQETFSKIFLNTCFFFSCQKIF